MCDYSLVAVASRPARVADRLITAGLRITSTRGFASTEDINTAVCLRPGTEVAFDHRPKYHRLWRHTAASNVARFRQINLEVQRISSRRSGVLRRNGRAIDQDAARAA